MGNDGFGPEMKSFEKYRLIRISTTSSKTIVSCCEIFDSTLVVGTQKGVIHVLHEIDEKNLLSLDSNADAGGQKKLHIHKGKVNGIKRVGVSNQFLSYDSV